MPAPEEETSRPRAVTIIGWLWLVLGVLFLLRTLINMVLWKMLRPDMLTFLDMFGQVPEQQQRLLRPLFEHLPTLQSAEAILSAAIIVIAIQFLRLVPWARAGMQAVCWLVLVLVAAFGAFWVWLWGTVVPAAPAAHASSFVRFGLIAGLSVCLAAAAGLAAMIALLGRSRVREAFRRAPGP